jgi:hypothetical protein
LPPNKRFQPTPLRVDKILAILAPGFISIVFLIYRYGAAELCRYTPCGWQMPDVSGQE